MAKSTLPFFPNDRGCGSTKFLSALLKPKASFFIFPSPSRGGVPDALRVRDLRRAPVVSGAACIHFALWRIWLCALTTSLPCGARPSVSIAFSTSLKRHSVRARTYPPYNIELRGLESTRSAADTGPKGLPFCCCCCQHRVERPGLRHGGLRTVRSVARPPFRPTARIHRDRCDRFALSPLADRRIRGAF
jgi:hypothetical protein